MFVNHSKRIAALVVSGGMITSGLALASGGSYDGVYSGTSTVTFGEPALCGTSGTVSVVLNEGKVALHWGDFSAQPAVADDGSFHGTVWAGLGRNGSRRRLVTHGKIAGPNLEAVLDTTLAQTEAHLCTYKWSLKRQ
jgi:hypothetical protein